MSYWGISANPISWGTIYNQSWVGEYIFLTCVGDGNDFYKRLSDASATMEAQDCLVNNMEKSLR